MISKNMIGKNLTNQIKQALTILIIQTKTIMRFIKSTEVGKVNFFKFFIIFIFVTFNPIVNSSETSKSLDGNFIEVKILDKIRGQSLKKMVPDLHTLLHYTLENTIDNIIL